MGFAMPMLSKDTMRLQNVMTKLAKDLYVQYKGAELIKNLVPLKSIGIKLQGN